MNFNTYFSDLRLRVDEEAKKSIGCPKCGGKRFTVKSLGVVGIDVRVACECSETFFDLDELLRTSSNRFRDVIVRVPEHCKGVVMRTEFESETIDHFSGKKNLIFAGDVGRGKTTQAWFIAVYRHTFFAEPFFLLRYVDLLSDKFSPAYDEMLKSAKNYRLLIIDDFARDAVKSDFLLSIVFDVVDYRYSRGLRTIFTTNAKSSAEIEARTNKAIVDRIMQSATHKIFTGESFRR